MVKKVVIAVVAAVLVIGGFGIQQATAKESLPEGSLMRKIDVRNCADRVEKNTAGNTTNDWLTKGATGHCVWILQMALKREGIDKNISTDGTFGNETADAVLKFNCDHALAQNKAGYSQAIATPTTFRTLAVQLDPYPGVQTRAPYKAAWDADTIG